MPVEVAEIILWGRTIGAVSWSDARGYASFEYDPAFRQSIFELAPLMMPLDDRVYSFPELAETSFQGLPGLLADALPDKFGNLLINEWLTRQGRLPGSFSAIERLCYTGTRGMGALEFKPVVREGMLRSTSVEIGALVQLAGEILSARSEFTTQVIGDDEEDVEALRDILRVGTSAGGARAKAVIAWNEASGEIRSGQVKAPEGYGYWLLKFDGVSGNRDKELEDPKGFTRIEYAYHKMAVDVGIEMSECRLFEENERSHFMTRRFDRDDKGGKRYMQSLCALGHMDFNRAGAYGYEQALDVALRLGMQTEVLDQLFLRMLFNVLARNQDDHTKNIAFMMDKKGRWSLSPAYDVTYSYNPQGDWTSRHQMSINGKRDDFLRDDFYAVAKRFRLGKKAKVDEMISRIQKTLKQWPDYAKAAGVPSQWVKEIGRHHRNF